MITCLDNHALKVTGKLFRTAFLRDEPYQCLRDPESFIEHIKRSKIRPDLFTFMQEIAETEPKHRFHLEWDSLAVLRVTTYESWLKNQVDSSARNKIRKAHKAGLELRPLAFDDDLVRSIMDIYNESPMRQRKRFIHYGKDFETIKADHATFLERSEFVGAIYRGELIGFIKFVKGQNVASLMQIISKLAHRDKAPTNALIAKAVEMCAKANTTHLHYGIWSRRGLGDFKISHGFIRHQVPRYYIPLNLKGHIFLKLRLHHGLRDYVPESWLNHMAELRTKWATLESGRVRQAN